jgi:hypothetical protein
MIEGDSFLDYSGHAAQNFWTHDIKNLDKR